MYSTPQNHHKFEHLETASTNVNSWPKWKKELAGVNITTDDRQEEKTRSCSTAKQDKE